MTIDGITTYYHSALAGAIVKPGSTSVMPDGGDDRQWGRWKEAGLRACDRETVVNEVCGNVPVAETDTFRGRFVFPRAVLPASSGSGV
jgi:hypothetical protein